LAIAARSGETTSVSSDETATLGVPDDPERSVLAEIMSFVAPHITGRSAQNFASDLLAVVARHTGRTVTAVVDRDDGRGAVPLATATPNGTAIPDATATPNMRTQRTKGGTALRVPLDLGTPWTGHLTLTTDGTPADLVARLVAQRLSAALEYERLRSADLRRQAWMSYLVEVGNLLAHSLDTALTEALIPRLIVPRLAPWCALYVIEERGAVRIATAAHADEAMVANMLSDQHFFGLRLMGDDMIAAVREATGATVFDGPACLMIPLRSHGLRIGALVLGREGTADPETVAIAEEVARRSATAMDNARVHAERQHVSRTLQEALLPAEPPEISNIGIGAAYLPAGWQTQVGGDMYDLIPLPDDGCLAVLGDVAGKGVQAAAVTGIVRVVLRVLIADGKPVPETLRQLNDLILSQSQRYCTMVLAQVRPITGSDDLSVTVYLAGHEQPLVVRRDGSVAVVGQWGTALGVRAHVHCVPESVILHPGDCLIMFSDGVTERRDGKEFFGPDRVVRIAGQLAGHPADVIADGLTKAVVDFSDDAPQDDITVVALRNDARTLFEAGAA
jgi:serine phosphatase RsbU (regulator of sigma subunit)